MSKKNGINLEVSNLIGIDIGNSGVRMAQLHGSSAQMAFARLPENMVRDGRIVSPELMAKFIKEMKAEYAFSGKKCAVILPEYAVFFRNLTMPPVTVGQLALNLPYEFRDYVGDEADSYNYDYAVESYNYGEEGKIESIDMVAAAALRETINQYDQLLKRAGLKLMLALPREMALKNMMKFTEKYQGLNEPELQAEPEPEPAGEAPAAEAVEEVAPAEEAVVEEAAGAAEEAAGQAAEEAAGATGEVAEQFAEEPAEAAEQFAEGGEEPVQTLDEIPEIKLEVNPDAGWEVKPVDYDNAGMQEPGRQGFEAPAEENPAPAENAFEEPEEQAPASRECVLIDIGYNISRIYIFNGTRIMASRIIDMGCRSIDEVIAASFNIDTYLAASYRETNYQGVITSEMCMNVYDRISLEIMKAMNFYRYENSDTEISEVYFSGTGSVIQELKDDIVSYTGLSERRVSDLLPVSAENEDLAAQCIMAIAATMQKGGF